MAETEFARAERYWRENCRLNKENEALKQLLYEGSLIVEDHSPTYTIWLEQVAAFLNPPRKGD